MLCALEVRLRCGHATAVCVISIALHGLLRVEEVLSRGSALDFALIKHLLVSGWLLLEEVLRRSNELSFFVSFAHGSFDRQEVSLLDSMARGRFLKSLKHRCLHVLEELSVSLSLVSVLELAEDGALGDEVLEVFALLHLHIRVDLHLGVGSLLELFALSCLHLRCQLLELSLDTAWLNQALMSAGRDAGHFEVRRLVLLHLELHVIL